MDPILTREEVDALDAVCEFVDMRVADDDDIHDSLLVIDDLITRLWGVETVGASKSTPDLDELVATVVYHV